MSTILHLKPRPSPATLIAWQFLGQPLHDCPSWVQSSCSLQRGPDGRLVHMEAVALLSIALGLLIPVLMLVVERAVRRQTAPGQA